MPGAMRKMGVYLGLVEDDDWADSDGYGHSGERTSARHEYAEPRYARASTYPRHSGGHSSAHGGEHGDALPSTREYRENVDEYDAPARADEAAPYQITTLHPRTYNEARTIGEQLRRSTPVIMNLSEMDDADAKRLVDFAAGLSFGLRGSIERVTAKVFLISPQNVDVTAEDKARIREGGFFNQS